MKRLNEYKRMVKSTLVKMLNEVAEGKRNFFVITDYSFSDYNMGDDCTRDYTMSSELAKQLICDLETFKFIELRVENGILKMRYHSNKWYEIKELETVEVIEEVKEVISQEIAPEATKEEITSSEKVEEIETTISYETARRAFYWISFSPDERGKSTISESKKEINSFLTELLKINTEKKGEIITDVKDWALKYDSKKTIWLNAMSNTASSAITGGANFPVERNRRKMEIAHNRSMELLEWMKKSKKALIKKYTAKEEEKDINYFVNEAYEEMKKYTKEELSRFAKVLIKDRLMRKIVNYAELSKENLKEAQEIAIKETTFFTSKHKIHNTLKNIESKFNRISEGTANKETIINNIKIVDSEENNRIELYFEGIPSADIRNYLKSKGFKWTPSKKAWQNYRNTQRLIEIKKYIETIGA